MHELQFMTNLVRMIEDVCKKQSDITPYVIKLEVASDSHIAGHSQEDLQTMFQFVARETKAQHAQLVIATTLVKGQCHECGTQLVCRTRTPTCPSCDSLCIDREPCPEVAVKEITYLEHRS